jgi:hypothetical protein
MKLRGPSRASRATAPIGTITGAMASRGSAPGFWASMSGSAPPGSFPAAGASIVRLGNPLVAAVAV